MDLNINKITVAIQRFSNKNAIYFCFLGITEEALDYRGGNFYFTFFSIFFNGFVLITGSIKFHLLLINPIFKTVLISCFASEHLRLFQDNCYGAQFRLIEILDSVKWVPSIFNTENMRKNMLQKKNHKTPKPNAWTCLSVCCYLFYLTVYCMLAMNRALFYHCSIYNYVYLLYF